MKNHLNYLPAYCALFALASCGTPTETTDVSEEVEMQDTTSKYLSEPLISDHYTADPSAHVFDGKIYIYPSHDVESDVPEDDLGAHFNMMDYHVYSMDSPEGTITDHGKVLGANRCSCR
mgnify:CR=1 FL=1